MLGLVLLVLVQSVHGKEETPAKDPDKPGECVCVCERERERKREREREKEKERKRGGEREVG